MSAPRQVLTIERLGAQGDGVAKGPVFVARTLPGEVVEGVVEAGRMAAPRILTPVAERVRPPCPHVKTCGGCSLQHARDDFLAGWKKQMVAMALQAHGLAAPIRGIVTSPPFSRRRATFAARRVKNRAQVGFHGLRSDTISEIDKCHLLKPELLGVLPLVGALARLGGSRKARLAVTALALEGGVDIAVAGGKKPDQALFAAMADLARGTPGVVRLSWQGEVVVRLGDARLAMGRAWVRPPPGAFLQATEEGEAALVAAVRQAVGPARRIADLFAGMGTFTFPLADRAMVHAVEGARDLCAALEGGWRAAQGLKQVSTELRDLFRRPLLPDELAGFDALVLDPPRAGAKAQVAEIARGYRGRLAMVSCNPQTFAADAAVLVRAGYRIDWIEVVDQFRWSPHVELVASLTPPGRP